MTTAVEQKHEYQIGDILYASWGYDQTNINFYRVVRTTAATITIEEIGKDVKEDGLMCGKATPNGVAKNDKIVTKRVGKYGRVKLSSFEYARKWDGKPMFCSWYA